MRSSGVVRNVTRSLLAVNSHVSRSHTCGELRIEHAGADVCLMGWLSFRRLNRFLVLRDAYGSVQGTIQDTDQQLQEKLSKISFESILLVKGRVRDRGKDRNRNMETGDIEVEVSTLEVINPARKDMPLLPGANAHELTRLSYRYIDLRSQHLQFNLRLRSALVHAARRFLVEQKGFVDVETPTLFRRTPGGAAEFIVPAQSPAKGLAYSLPQSPQQFKQLLMVGGIDRYFQIARCYRDEGSKSDRQPEFTQLDIEISYPTQDSLMDLLEEVLLASWPDHLTSERPSRPFRRMPFSEAIRDYGVDKPDLRIPWKITPVNTSMLNPLRGANSDSSWCIRAVVARGTGKEATRTRAKEWKRLVNMNHNATTFVVLSRETKKSEGRRWFNFVDDDAVWKEFQLQENDTLILAWGIPSSVQWTLGQLRSYLGEAAGLRKQKAFRPLWVVEFPLFEKNEEGRLVSCHHPFTAPVDEDAHLIEREQGHEHIRAQHFDLVMNGMELGGGSIRIHNGQMQRRVLDILNEKTHEMTHLLSALESGAPPHGGFAFGLDRLVAMFAGNGDSSYGIRDVIAFPKSKEGRDLMVDTPIEPSKEELDRYGFALAPKE